MWEMIKGNESHFDGAPDWATVAIQHAHCDDVDFAESNKYDGSVYNVRTGSTFIVCNSSAWTIIAERRKWQPTVGQQLEFARHHRGKIAACNWRKATVQYLSDHTVVLQTDAPGEEVGHPINFIFRPVQSTRDKATSQMNQQWRDKAGADHLNIYAVIYDAIVAGKIDGLGKVD